MGCISKSELQHCRADVWQQYTHDLAAAGKPGLKKRLLTLFSKSVKAEDMSASSGSRSPTRLARTRPSLVSALSVMPCLAPIICWCEPNLQTLMRLLSVYLA